MFRNEYGEAAVEVLDILDNTNKEDVAKIPSSFIKFLVDNASEDYVVNFDHSKPISELNIKEKTKEILGTIYINWWCDNNQKEHYKKQIEEQEKREQEQLNMKNIILIIYLKIKKVRKYLMKYKKRLIQKTKLSQ